MADTDDDDKTNRDGRLREAEEWFSSAGKLLKDGKPETAFEHLNKAIAINPLLHTARLVRAATLYELGRNAKAIEDYTVAINAGIGDKLLDLAYFGRGGIYEELGESDKAIDDYTKVISLNHAHTADSYKRRARNYFSKKEYERAVDDYGSAISLDSNDAHAYNGRGHAQLFTGQFQKAVEDLSKAISIDQNYIDAYSNRGVAYVGMKNYEKAIPDLQKASAAGDEVAREVLKGVIKQIEKVEDKIVTLREVEPFNLPPVDNQQAALFTKRLNPSDGFIFDHEKKPKSMLIYELKYAYPNLSHAHAWLLSVNIDTFQAACESGKYNTMEEVLSEHVVGTLFIEYGGDLKETSIDAKVGNFDVPTTSANDSRRLEKEKPVSVASKEDNPKLTCSKCGRTFLGGKKYEPGVKNFCYECIVPMADTISGQEYEKLGVVQQGLINLIRKMGGVNASGGKDYWITTLKVNAEELSKDALDNITDYTADARGIDRDYEKLSVSGLEAMLDKEYSKAAEIFRNLIDRFPEEGAPYIRLCGVLRRMDQLQGKEPISMLNKAEQLIKSGKSKYGMDKWDGLRDLYYLRACCLVDQGKTNQSLYAKAEEDLAQALELDPEYKDALSLRRTVQESRQAVGPQVTGTQIRSEGRDSIVATPTVRKKSGLKIAVVVAGVIALLIAGYLLWYWQTTGTLTLNYSDGQVAGVEVDGSIYAGGPLKLNAGPHLLVVRGNTKSPLQAVAVNVKGGVARTVVLPVRTEDSNADLKVYSGGIASAYSAGLAMSSVNTVYSAKQNKDRTTILRLDGIKGLSLGEGELVQKARPGEKGKAFGGKTYVEVVLPGQNRSFTGGKKVWVQESLFHWVNGEAPK